MKLTTTLNLIRSCDPGDSEWKTLNEALGSDFNQDEEINLLKILDTNGVQDMLRCLRATVQYSRKIASQLAIEFAEQALPIFELHRPNDPRPRNAIQAARDFNVGKITAGELLACRRDAATAAASASAYDAYASAAADAAAYADAYAAVAAVYAADASADASAADAADAAADAADAAADAADAAAYAADAADADAARIKAKEKQAEIIRSILEA